MLYYANAIVLNSPSALVHATDRDDFSLSKRRPFHRMRAIEDGRIVE